MVKGAKEGKKCTLDMLPAPGKSTKLVSLFEMKKMKGFWPCYDEKPDGTRECTVRGLDAMDDGICLCNCA